MEKERENSEISTIRPEEAKEDSLYTNVKIMLSAIPIVGGTASEIFSSIIVPPIAKRRDAWIESIADGLVELQKRFDSFDIGNLQNNETSISLLMQATQIAIRNHQKEKLGALRNAVLNSALTDDSQQDMRLIFLNIVDDLTPLHLVSLNFINNPDASWRQSDTLQTMAGRILNDPLTVATMGRLFHDLENAYPKRLYFLYRQIINDLKSKGLIDFQFLSDGSSHEIDELNSNINDVIITDMGKQFIQFISYPV